MSLDRIGLSLLVFPQHWDGQRLHGSVVVLPRGDPMHAPLFPYGQAFAGTPLTLRLAVQPGGATFQSTAPGLCSQVFTPHPSGADARALFAALHAQFLPTPPPSNPAALERSRRQRSARLAALGPVVKALPDSYRTAAGFVAPRHPEHVVSDADHARRLDRPAVRDEPAYGEYLSWGQVISHALRQPALARALGLAFDFDTGFTGWDLAGLLSQGGWIQVALAPSMAAPPVNWPTGADHVAAYAARLPPLGAQPRPLFAAVLFPEAMPTGPQTDRLLAEARAYDDGFARVVHGGGPSDDAGGPAAAPGVEAGVALGWDDEQVLAWVNRQLDHSRALGDGAHHPGLRAPLGVAGYRIDVRKHGGDDTGWCSLCGVQGEVTLAGWSAHYSGEFCVDTAPLHASGVADAPIYLPRHFATWRGASLIAPDPIGHRLAGAAAPPSAWTPQPWPVERQPVALRYGASYDFRVRLADLSGGGPRVGDHALGASTASIARVRFERRVPPKALRIEPGGADATTSHPTQLRLRRPLLPHPDFTFAGVEATPALIDALVDQLASERTRLDGLGVPDPDVTHAVITVQVRAPRGDRGGPWRRDGEYVELFSVLKALPACHGLTAGGAAWAEDDSGLALEIRYVDCADVGASAEALKAASTGCLLSVPTGRDVRLHLRAAHRPAPGRPSHFARGLHAVVDTETVVPGLVADVSLRQEEAAPLALLDVGIAASERTVAMLLRSPDAMERNSPDPLQLVARTLGLRAQGLTLRAPPGQRVVFAATGRLRHALANANSLFTLASRDELYRHWIVVHRVRLERDWTWDGLLDQGLAIERLPDGSGRPLHTLGHVALPFVVSDAATEGDAVRRDHSVLVLFDAIEPYDLDNGGLAELQRGAWHARAPLRAGGDVTGTPSRLALPIAHPPREVPRVVAVGIARSADGASARPEALWIEFEHGLPVDPQRPDQGLKYNARVLLHRPDPLITAARDAPAVDEAREPPWPVDPPWICVVCAGQRPDPSGCDAMVELVPAVGADPDEAVRHWLLPLPPGVDAGSALLFGFWTYELRIGHAAGHWTTTQARFGPPLRLAGVQHPPPELVGSACRVRPTQPGDPPSEIDGDIVVRAPFATAAGAGTTAVGAATRARPQTDLWALLYVQIEQADGSGRHDLLLGRQPMRIADRPTEEPLAADGPGPGGAVGRARFDRASIERQLGDLGLAGDATLSVRVVELLPNSATPRSASDAPADPLGRDLGRQRLLRVSRPIPVDPA